MESSRPAKRILLWRGSAWVKQQESVLGQGRQGHRRFTLKTMGILDVQMEVGLHIRHTLLDSSRTKLADME